MSQKSGKGDALRKKQALLDTFVAGQKYGVGRDPPVLFLSSKNNKDNRCLIYCPLSHEFRLYFVSSLATDKQNPCF